MSQLSKSKLGAYYEVNGKRTYIPADNDAPLPPASKHQAQDEIGHDDEFRWKLAETYAMLHEKEPIVVALQEELSSIDKQRLHVTDGAQQDVNKEEEKIRVRKESMKNAVHLKFYNEHAKTIEDWRKETEARRKQKGRPRAGPGPEQSKQNAPPTGSHHPRSGPSGPSDGHAAASTQTGHPSRNTNPGNARGPTPAATRRDRTDKAKESMRRDNEAK